MPQSGTYTCRHRRLLRRPHGQLRVHACRRRRTGRSGQRRYFQRHHLRLAHAGRYRYIHTISANAGDDLPLPSTRTSSSSYFYVTLHGPDGEWIATEYASSGYRLDTYDLPETGRYTYRPRVLRAVRGELQFHRCRRRRHPGRQHRLHRKRRAHLRHARAGDIDTYTISANAGDDLLFTIDETTSTKRTSW